jgi:dTDP-glucose pyrophosphorylase
MQRSLAITAVIPAAGKPTNRILQNSNLPDTMIPINGKPVIGYILEDLLSRGITRAAIVLNQADTHTEKYVRNKFSDKMALRVMYADKNRGVGYSIWLGAKDAPKTDSLLVYLGDTIYKGPLDFKKNFLVASSQYEESNKWCFAEKTGTGLRFINKPDHYKGSGTILCGLYYFASGEKLAKAFETTLQQHDRIEISSILEAYQREQERFQLVPAKKWYDCGNIENYHAARVDFLRLRKFNRLDYNPTTGIITKSSTNVQKIRQEINWYLNMPDELKPLAPRILDHEVNEKSARYAMEYYGYQSLGDIFLYSYQDLAIWRSILRHLFVVIKMFKQHKAQIPFAAFSDIYVTKTIDRLDQMKKQKDWARLLAMPEIRINGTTCKNIDHFLPTLPARVKKLYKKQDMAFLHGDMCLSNILYDAQSRLIKLVDPRGYFGKMGVYGDIKYDLGKLRHSFDGYYEFIISDLFKLTELAPGDFTFEVYVEEYHKQLAALFDRMLSEAGYRVQDAMLIEALLFISMIPLHANAPLRQKAMYITGIRLLNQLD